MMVPEGGSAKLICRAKGFPQPKITWRREDGREIIARNGPHGKTKGMYFVLYYIVVYPFVKLQFYCFHLSHCF